MLKVNQRASRIEGSATLALAARARELADQGLDVVSMAVGEPDFPTPEPVRDAVRAHLDTGLVRYTPAGGTPALRRALAAAAGGSRGIELAPDEVVATHSCKHALTATLSVLCEPGDRVLMLEPVWGSYQAGLEWSGAEAVRVRPRADLGPDLEAIAAAAKGARGIMVNSPTNPSGYVWSKEEFEALLDIAEREDLWVLSDEIYRRISYGGGQACSPLSLGERARKRVIAVDGASKTLSMTGFRIGCVIGDRSVVDAVGRVQSETTGCPNALAQTGWQHALQQEPAEVAEMVAAFERRRDLLVGGLNDLGLPCTTPGGAYYAFPSISGVAEGRRSAEFCSALLEQEHLVLVPGEIFGMDDHVRLSYALAEADLERALERLARFLGR